MAQEKETEISPADGDKTAPPEYTPSQHLQDEKKERKGSVVSAEVLRGEIFDDRYERTKRGRFPTGLETTTELIIYLQA